MNLSYVSIGTVWYGTVRVRRGSRRWNMSMISWQQKVSQLPKRISYMYCCDKRNNDEWAEAEAERQMKKRKVAVTDGRLPLMAAMLHVVKLATASAAQHYCPYGWYVVNIYVRACTVYCFLVARRSRGNMISSSYTQEKRIDRYSR